MKVKVAFFILLFGLNNFIIAQKNEFNISTGYLFGFRKMNDETRLKWDGKKDYSLGGGNIIQLEYSRIFDSSRVNFENSLCFITGNKQPIYNYIKNEQTFNMLNGSNNILSYQIGFGVNFKINKIKLRWSNNLILPIINSGILVHHIKDSLAESMFVSQANYYFNIGYGTSFLSEIPLGENITLNFGLKSRFIHQKIKSERYTVVSYSSVGNTFPQTFDETYKKDFNYVKNATDIKNNKDFLPAQFNPNKPSDYLSYKNSFSSIGLVFGFKFSF